MKGKKDIVKLWLQKAESDLRTAKILVKSKDAPPESICFHAQQAVEKFLKAFLTWSNIRAGKTHDISVLLRLCMEEDKEFEELDIEKLGELTLYAVEVRYPESFYTPSLEEALDAVKLAEQVKDFILRKLWEVQNEG